MALSDLFKDLDPTLASVLSEATEELRGEFEEKLAATRAELGLEPSSEPSHGEETAAAPAPTPTSEASVGPDLLDPIGELKHAVVAVDGSSSQGEVLAELLSGCSRFASRCAIFLLREERVSGWSSFGFAADSEATRDIGFAIVPGSPWERLARDEGTLPLDTAGATPICELLASEAPQIGLLIPFVLGNQTAAAIYCDRLGDDDPPNISALQLLAFIASQVLENLPVRDRDSTSTLTLADAAPDTGPETSIQAPETPPAAEPEAVMEETAQPEAGEPAPVAGEETEETEAIEEVGQVEEVEEELPPPSPAIEEESLGAPELPAPPVEPAALEFEEPEERSQREATAEVESSVTELPEEAESAPPSPEPTFQEVTEPEALVEPSPPTPAPTPEPVRESTETPAVDEAPDGTESPSLPTGNATQVAPPDDLEGPGWAFSGGRDQSQEGTDDSQNEEARRLARLLVTEIKLYNEELVEEGRRKSDVYSVLKEDIDRSRQIFNDRIDEEVRSHHDYFREALVRILAGGDPETLGL